MPVEQRRETVRDLVSIVTLFVLLSALYWAAIWLVCGKVGFPLDDAFIHLQFARNLYNDGQMAFNVGVSSGGSTAPLYPALLAGFFHFLGNWYAAGYVLGALCSLGTAVAVYGIARSWTGRTHLARWAGLLTVVVAPTVTQAYGGMEAPVYSLLFLAGLWCYAQPRSRPLASVFWALAIWLRPEFMLLCPLILLERFLAHRRAGDRRLVTLFTQCATHLIIWAAMMLAYAAYHHHQDGQFVPTTFAAKSVTRGLPKPAWMDSFPAALDSGHWGHLLLSFTVWPTAILLSVALGIGINCAPLAFGLRRAVTTLWHGDEPSAAGWRIGILIFLAYPWFRGLVDTWGVFMFQQQRYFAHFTPLAILLVIGAHRGGTDSSKNPQRRRTFYWAFAGFLLTTAISVQSVSNINAMQVKIGDWIRNNTARDQLIAANDIGAIGFIGERRILDTVGLVEPDLVEHYRSGGTLPDYLAIRDPAYVVLFPNWYPDLVSGDDLLEEAFSVDLPLNVVCGGSRMVVYRFKR